MTDDSAPLGGPLADRFPFLAQNSRPAPAPTEAEWDQIGPAPDGFDTLLSALDGLARALADTGEPPRPLPGRGEAQAMPDALLLYNGAAFWSTARVRGLLHQYLTRPGASVNDPDALLLQGVLLGAQMVHEAGSTRVFRAGYSPFEQ